MLTLLGFFSPRSVCAQTENLPGLLESTKELISINKDQIKNLKFKISSNPKILSSIGNLKDLRLDPYFLKSILFFSDRKIVEKASKDKCTFYSYLDNDLFKYAEGDLDNIIVTFLKNKEEKESAIITKNDFIEHVYKDSCLQNKEMKNFFSRANVFATINKLKVDLPKTEVECNSMLESWKNNSYLPHLCGISKILKDGQIASISLDKEETLDYRAKQIYTKRVSESNFYRSGISQLKSSFLENLCDNFDSREDFCKPYLAFDIWNKVISGEQPSYKMNYICMNLLNKEKLSNDDLNICKSKIDKNQNSCSILAADKFSSFIPKPNCNIVSEALMSSSLITKYHDCPGLIDNEAIINTYRLMMHFSNRSIVSTPKNCASDVIQEFANINLKRNNLLTEWPLQICFFDKILEKKVCHEYIPGDFDHKKSESSVIKKIIQRTHSLDESLKCNIVDSESYKPNLLTYRNGCFVVYDANFCTPLSCPKKIFLNQKPITGISYVGTPKFEYIPNSFTGGQYSQISQIKEDYDLKETTIRNLTDLGFFIENKKNIVHGVGCLEDIFPHNFRKKYFNQCTPLPFIIDGMITKKNTKFLITRTAIDDIHAPRLVSWNIIFTAVANYQQFHPLNTWTLYGIKK